MSGIVRWFSYHAYIAPGGLEPIPKLLWDRLSSRSNERLGAAQEQVPQIPRETSLFERLSQYELCTLFVPAHLENLAHSFGIGFLSDLRPVERTDCISLTGGRSDHSGPSSTSNNNDGEKIGVVL